EHPWLRKACLPRHLLQTILRWVRHTLGLCSRKIKNSYRSITVKMVRAEYFWAEFRRDNANELFQVLTVSYFDNFSYGRPLSIHSKALPLCHPKQPIAFLNHASISRITGIDKEWIAGVRGPFVVKRSPSAEYVKINTVIAPLRGINVG